MPVAPKSPPSSATSPSSAKRPGAPKAKGAVRAKSGCYTCRIRRKKCDEQPNDQGFCSTCVRLRLECLGFGAKRPDWLRENRNVLQLRDKIKNFLASQGMIKGHSGSGARSSDQPPVLRLTITEAETPSYHSGSSSSPPSRSQTLPEDYARSRHPTSHTRGSGWNNIDQAYHPNGHYATNSEYHRSTSPQSMDGGYSHPLSSSSPHSLVPPFPQRTIHRFHPYRQRQQFIMQGPNWNPAKTSSFGNSYNWGAQDYADMLNPAPFDLPTQPYMVDPSLSYGSFPPVFDAGATPYFTSHPTPYHDVDFFLRCYVTDVVNKQYLLSTNSSRSLITSAISNRSSHEQQAATLLSRVHSLRFGRPPTELVLSDPGVSLELHGIEEALASCSSSLTSEHAMAALHLVSAILFDGGHGRWSQYLHTAAVFVRSRMTGLAWNNNGLEELRTLKDKDAFIVKTAIWFDVLASVTTNKAPLLLDIVRLLFRPDRSGVQELYNNNTNNSEFNNNAIEHPEMYAFPENTMSEKEKTSMLSPMGCENIVVWALAEISALATWKKAQSELGRLSIEDLVMRGQKIKDALDTRYRGPAMIGEDFPDDVAYSRYLTAHIFRASAKLYLAAVVSGGYPHVPQVKSAVDEVMGWISRIPKKPTREDHVRIHKSVIRSTIFAFYITGALTDKDKHRKLLREYLLDEGSVVGNSQITEQLLVDIWAERTKDRAKREVLWRERLLNNQDPILLV